MHVILFFMFIITAFVTGGMRLADPDGQQERLNKSPRYRRRPMSRDGVIFNGWLLIIMGIIGLLMLPII